MTGKTGKQPCCAAERHILRQDWPILLLWAASFLGGLLVYPRLHGPIAIHWNAAGEANGFTSPLGAVLELPLITLGVYAMLVLVPRLDPFRANYERFGSTMRVLRWEMVISMVGMHWLGLAPALGVAADPDRLRRFLIAALFVVIGNVLGLVRRNFFVGIRTPWALADERVWQRTHRFGGRLFVGCGLVGMASVLLPKAVGTVIFVTALSVALVVSVAYSYVEFRRVRGDAGAPPPQP